MRSACRTGFVDAAPAGARVAGGSALLESACGSGTRMSEVAEEETRVRGESSANETTWRTCSAERAREARLFWVFLALSCQLSKCSPRAFR